MAAKVPLHMMNEPKEPPPAPSSRPDAPLREKIIDAIRTCFDPEIPVNICELGLIYAINLGQENAVEIKMTLTSPACPAAGSLPTMVQAKVKAVPGVSACKVEVVWDPPWEPSRMSEAAKLQLGLV
jgi:FeS assembly SUF system protein